MTLTNSPPVNVPHPVTVARIALNLAQLQEDLTSIEHVEIAKADIKLHGLAAFFSAANPRPLTGQTIDVAPAITVAPTGIPQSGEPREYGGQQRQTWTDCIGARISQPLKMYRPTTREELESIVAEAIATGCRVKAVGSGHSFSDVAVTRDVLIETHGLNRPLPLERDVLRSGVDAFTLFETEAGITVRDLNEALWNEGLGLLNMGGYDGQTLAGVISTSTHGSGISFGPLSSFVESLTLVAGDGRTYRVEPTGGITDPTRWRARHPTIELKQDDDLFAAAAVSVGCFGVVYSAVLRVRPRYWLQEDRTLSTWSQVKHDLRDGTVLADNSHYELLINPYPTGGDHTCLITRRNPVDEPTISSFEEPRRNFFVELAASVPGASDVLHAVLDDFPQLTPTIIDKAMEAIAVEYVDRSYRVFNIGTANEVPAYGSEIGFTMDRYQDAVERIIKIAAQRQEIGQAYLVSPFSLRFVKASPAYLSMMHGADTCMIEFPMLRGTVGGIELLQAIETEMYQFGGRPHWGLLNFLSGANGLLEAMYPALPRWLELYRQLDPGGTFDNAFTERCGFSPRQFVRG